MTSKQIYDLAIKLGIKADLRGEECVKKYLERAKKKFAKLSDKEKKNFDKEKLINPYSDTRFLIDNKKGGVKKAMVGIDVGGSEMLLAREMKVDLIINHHPVGRALADLSSVMDLQIEVLAQYGMPVNIAEQAIKPRISEVGRKVASGNYNRTVDFANLLKLDLMCLHTACDNMAANFVVREVKRKKPEYVEDVLEILNSISEYREAAKNNAGPKIFAGAPENRCGKIVVAEFTGGTGLSKDIYEKMAQAGIGTTIGMHMDEEGRKEAEKNHVNVIIAGHMSSDSLGLNLFIDELEKKGVEIVPISGFIRIKRFKKKRK